MSKFSIDTEKVSAVATEVSGLSSSSSSVASSVSGYDTTNEDGFDFSGAKSSIENNVDGMKIKVNNTSVLLDAVVDTHSNLQDSVSGGDSSGGGSSNNGGYNYSGGYGPGSGGGSSGGGGGGSSSQSSSSSGTGQSILTQNGETSGKVVLSEESSAETIDMASLSVADPLAADIETAIKENPSAYEKLLEELGKVEAEVGKAESTLNEELEITLSSNSIKKTSAEGIVTESFTKTLLVIEASTETPGIVQYVKDVNEVAKEHHLEVRFLELDEIINVNPSGSFNENKTDSTFVIKSDTQKEVKESENLTTKEPEEKESTTININTTPSLSPTATPVESLNGEVIEESSLNIEAPEEQKEEIINVDELEQAESEKANEEKEEPLKIKEGIITKEEKEKEEKIISGNTKGLKEEISEDKKEEKEKEIDIIDNSKIKDKAKYDRLMSIPTSKGVKNDLFNSPVTMIIKNNLITNSMTGIASKEKIELFIKSSGIDIEDITM